MRGVRSSLAWMLLAAAGCGDTLSDTGASDGPDLSSAEAVLADSGGGLATGQVVAAAGDANGDGTGDLLIAGTGEAWLVCGPVQGNFDLVDAPVRLYETTLCFMGGCDVAGAGDLDGDGQVDVVVGHAYELSESHGAGLVYLLPGPLDGEVALADTPAAWTGEMEAWGAGWSVAMGGDVDGDGLDDLVVGSPMASRIAEEAGAVYLVLGSTEVFADGRSSLQHADAHWLGASAGDHAGLDIAIGGDANGDGLADLLVGAPDESSAGQWAGAIYVVLGRADIEAGSSRGLGEADATLLGEGAYDSAGNAVAWAGDMDGDGLDDVLVGAQLAKTGDTTTGAAYLACGLGQGSASLAMATARLQGEEGSWTGESVTVLGDVDADGFLDLAVGAPGSPSDEAGEGKVWIVHGPLAGSVALSEVATPIPGEQVGDRAGASLAGVGDSDGDGLPDLLVGAPGSDRTGENGGAAFLLAGGGL